MIIDGTATENALKRLLQKHITIYIKNKVFKRGKLLLFRQNNYHLELTIERNDKQVKKFEIPIPYNIEAWPEDNLVYFDYRLITLAKKDERIYNLLNNVSRIGNSKFYDTIVEIEIEESINE